MLPRRAPLGRARQARHRHRGRGAGSRARPPSPRRRAPCDERQHRVDDLREAHGGAPARRVGSASRACPRLIEEDGERWHVDLPLDERGDEAARALDRAAVRLPDRLRHGMAMRIDRETVKGLVTREVDLANAVDRDRVDDRERVVPEVGGIDDDVGHVEEQAAAARLGDAPEERPLGHRRPRHHRIRRQVLEEERRADALRRPARALGQVLRAASPTTAAGRRRARTRRRRARIRDVRSTREHGSAARADR